MPTVTVKPHPFEDSQYKVAKATCSGVDCDGWEIIQEAYSIIPAAEAHVRQAHGVGYIATANGSWRVSA